MKVIRLAIALTLLLVARLGRADDPKRYEGIDAHALKATAKDEASLPSLARYLAKPCKTDRDKARAIYRWITDRIAYDVEAWTTGRTPAQNPAAVLKTRKAVCQGFSELFVDLSQRMGLKAVLIPGWIKPLQHKPGNKVTVPQYSHGWNAVHVEGEWRLIDSTLAAGHVMGKEFTKRFRNGYFFPPAEAFQLTHLPRDTTWQLSKKPLTPQQFEQEPIYSPFLGDLGVDWQSVRDAIRERPGQELVMLYTHPGVNTIALKMPLHRQLKAGEEYEFRFKSSDYPKMYLMIPGKMPVELEKEGDIHRISIRLEKGQVRVSGLVSGTTRAPGIVTYNVE